MVQWMEQLPEWTLGREVRTGKAPAHPAPRAEKAGAHSPIHWRKKSNTSGALGSAGEREAWVKQGLGISGRKPLEMGTSAA